jgi:hypothetical protein
MRIGMLDRLKVIQHGIEKVPGSPFIQRGDSFPYSW